MVKVLAVLGALSIPALPVLSIFATAIYLGIKWLMLNTLEDDNWGDLLLDSALFFVSMLAVELAIKASACGGDTAGKSSR